MNRSPLFRLLGSVLALVFAANVALAGRPHGCVADPERGLEQAASQAPSGHASHGGTGHVPAGSAPLECDCVGHACCSSAVLAIATGQTSTVVTGLEYSAADPLQPVTVAPLPPPYLLPFSLAPPAHMS